MKGVNRQNIGTKTDRFDMRRFDHLEFWTMDAKSCSKALKVGLGMEMIGFTGQKTGNHQYTGYVLKTGTIKWSVLAPYLSEFQHPDQKPTPHPDLNPATVRDWVCKHGSGVAVIGIEVADAKEAWEKATGKGEPEGSGPWAKSAMEPKDLSTMVLSEIYCYGDTIIRFVQYKEGHNDIFLPGYEKYQDASPLNYGIHRMDHVVGNVYVMDDTINDLKKWLGLHTFAKFTKEDIQTEYTSLNSEVLSNDHETVLLPINEPAKKKRESQITEYLKAYNGPGVQHLALFTKDVCETVGLMSKMSDLGGFKFIPTPPSYYEDSEIIKRMNEHLTPEAQVTIKEHGILVDEDEEGILLQIFTEPLFDRATLFVEIIQRICKGEVVDKPGCGGFGKGNFRALFESIERMQKERGMLLEENKE